VADVVVIGAGIIGSSVALHLARAGASVVIVDAGLPGRATTAGAGIISPLGLTRSDEDADWTRIVEASTSEYARMFEELGDGAAEAGEYRVVGELVAAPEWTRSPSPSVPRTPC
jgi:glycine/D-amino acid oxidase-like deaminating enzyme